MRQIREMAFAKLNLTLDVLDKRPDGYHEMETVMQSVGLCDEVDITITDGPGIEVDISREDLPKGIHNLAGKAAQEFLSYVNRPDIGVKVYITKNIPDRAGMAGGSSDAAAVIRGLDRLLETGLSEEELLQICAKVGSDVAFCLRGGACLARGRGEILTALPPMPDCDIAIVKPDFSVSTQELFAALDGIDVAKRPDTAGFLDALRSGSLYDAGALMVNVFEEALPDRERRVVENVKRAFTGMGALGAAMTGTGSAVFGVFDELDGAAKAKISHLGIVFFTKPV